MIGESKRGEPFPVDEEPSRRAMLREVCESFMDDPAEVDRTVEQIIENARRDNDWYHHYDTAINLGQAGVEATDVGGAS